MLISVNDLGSELQPRHTPLVSGWWGRRCGAGDCPEYATGCRPDGRAGTAASRGPNRRARPYTDQAATDGSLTGVIRVCACRQTKRQRQRNPA